MRPNNNNLIYNVHTFKEIMNRRCMWSPGGQRQIVSVSGQLTKEVRFRPM